jgi:hypothetical protein
MSGESYWVRWHRTYETEGSHLQLRVAVVERHIRDWLAAAAPGEPLRVLSLCAGQGRDLIGALAEHPRRAAVRARLVELDPRLAADARAAADAAGLEAVEVVQGDASRTDAALGIAPVELLLACGIFGNVSDDDIRHTIECLPMLCAPRATVVWTRHRMAPDLTPRVRAWFEAAGFEEVAFETPAGTEFVGVGVHRLAVAPRALEPGVRLFTFFDTRGADPQRPG